MSTIKMPTAVDSEKIVLGSILIEGREAIKKVGHILKYSDFYEDSHRYIYRAMEKLFREQQDIDVTSVYNVIQEKGFADQIGGASSLVELTSDVHTTAHIVTHARTVSDRAALRRMIRASQDIMKLTQDGEDLDKVLSKSEEIIKGVTRGASKVEDKLATVDLEEWRKIARDTEDRAGELHGISTGIKVLDEMTEGFEPGEMMILTGHTKHGKSRLATNIAWNVARQGKTVYFINTEMTKLQMGRRFNSLAGTESPKGKIILNDKAGLEYLDVLRIMERAKEKGCDLVIVDHLHFFSRSVENQTAEISKISKDFKDAAVELELPIILLCHVQQGDTRKRPTLQMIKNSSSIAQDADVVIGVWMDDKPDGDNSYSEILRLAHRSAEGSKRYATVYNDGMKITEQAPPKEVGGYDPNALIEGGAKDDDDLDIDF